MNRIDSRKSIYLRVRISSVFSRSNVRRSETSIKMSRLFARVPGLLALNYGFILFNKIGFFYTYKTSLFNFTSHALLYMHVYNTLVNEHYSYARSRNCFWLSIRLACNLYEYIEKIRFNREKYKWDFIFIWTKPINNTLIFVKTKRYKLLNEFGWFKTLRNDVGCQYTYYCYMINVKWLFFWREIIAYRYREKLENRKKLDSLENVKFYS